MYCLTVATATYFVHESDECGEGAADFIRGDLAGVHGGHGVHDAVAEPGEHASHVQHGHGAGHHHEDPADDEGNGAEQQRRLAAEAVGGVGGRHGGERGAQDHDGHDPGALVLAGGDGAGGGLQVRQRGRRPAEAGAGCRRDEGG